MAADVNSDGVAGPNCDLWSRHRVMSLFRDNRIFVSSLRERFTSGIDRTVAETVASDSILQKSLKCLKKSGWTANECENGGKLFATGASP